MIVATTPKEFDKALNNGEKIICYHNGKNLSEMNDAMKAHVDNYFMMGSITFTQKKVSTHKQVNVYNDHDVAISGFQGDHRLLGTGDHKGSASVYQYLAVRRA